MKKSGLTILVILFACSCALEGYNTQKGAAIGAVGGALAGQAIGRNTAGTLIGAAGGALVGAVAGDAVDQSQNRKKLEMAQATGPSQVTPPTAEETPPGQWVEVPGRWVDGKWVPSHRVWTPINPGQADTQGTTNVPSPPPYAVSAPPAVVPVPGTYVYFIPYIGVDVFFYRGYWYRPYRNNWYRSSSYNGPWAYMPPVQVPRSLTTLPDGYRRVPSGSRSIPHNELQKNWERWEHERHWDRHPG
ncbi:MAG: hypothetical protein A4E57_03054 [Syntrophorhabdaceae bacterium PtaU1.Bin034]|nr:MAG: hypothetical protein A4E57_03054 [Syntrophorhabdaceae bacterium PtaU1.Bin034]